MHLAALLLVAPMTLTLAPAGAAPKPLAECDGLPTPLPAQVQPVGPSAWHVVQDSKARWLAFVDGGRCTAYRIGRAAARVRAPNVGGVPGAQKAYILAPSIGCDGGCEGVPAVVAVRGARPRPLATLQLPSTCNAGVQADPLPLFPGAPSVALRCRESMGAGSHRERLFVLHGRAGTLRVVLQANLGWHEALSHAEQAAGDCPAEPAGWLKVVTQGPRPVVRLLEPNDPKQVDGQGIAQVFEHAFDPAAGRFVRRGPATPTPYDMRAACRVTP